MGAVYRARNLDLDSPVALKLMRRETVEDIESIERFYREARAASRLRHPNSIRVFDFGQAAELDGLVMSLLQKEPSARPADAEDVLARIAAIRQVGNGAAPAEADGRGRQAVHEELEPTTPVSVPSAIASRSDPAVEPDRRRAEPPAGIASPPREPAPPPRAPIRFRTAGLIVGGIAVLAGQGDDQPVVCVDWEQARAFARWAGGRLPSEAEWEYAARGGGRDRAYPWGNEKPDCSMAVMDDGRNGCGRSAAWPVCSRPGGHTADGLCDMSGNVAEWLQDVFHKTYEGAPSDGRPWEGPGTHGRVVRGGSWYAGPDGVRTTFRDYYPPGHRSTRVGVRVARDAR